MINHVMLIGRLGKDPELRSTPNGKNCCSFTLAVGRDIASGASVTQDTDWINCVVWGLQAENLCKYQEKGSLIAVEGRIQTRNYENQQGQKVYVTEVLTSRIQYLESKRKAQEQTEERAPATNSYGYKEYYAEQEKKAQSVEYAGSLTNGYFEQEDGLDIASDDLPF